MSGWNPRSGRVALDDEGPMAAMTDEKSLTARAVRIEDKAREVRHRLEQIANRALPPRDRAERDKDSAPTSSHAVFALESAERLLDESLQITEAVLCGL